MKTLKLTLFLFTLCGCYSLYSQKVKSNTVRFRLNNAPVEEVLPEPLPDTLPPVITLVTPLMDEGNWFETIEEEIDLIGEISDESKIRFVSVNREILMVNEVGIFMSSLKLSSGTNDVRIRAMDDHNNIQEHNFVIEYNPPIVTLADRINKESTYYGLLIGIDDYKDPKLPDLDNPIRDAEKLYNALVSRYTFEPENMKLLKNPDRKEIIDEMNVLRGKVSSRDNVIIFYAGHGYYDEVAEIGYWFPSDASRNSEADWFPNSTLVNNLKAINSKHTLLITDACFAGSIFKVRTVSMQEVVYEKIYELPSRKAMTSGTLTEVPDQSAFIKYLIQRLNENEADYLSSEELFTSLKYAVTSNSNVLPRYGDIQNVGNQGGDFIFLRKK